MATYDTQDGKPVKRMRCLRCGPVGTKAFFDRTPTGWACRCCGDWRPSNRTENNRQDKRGSQ